MTRWLWGLGGGVAGDDPDCLGKAFKTPLVLLSENRKQRQDEVGLGQHCAAAIDAQKDLGHALLVDLVADLGRKERKVLQATEASERDPQLLLPTLIERLRFRCAQTLNERLDPRLRDQPISLLPQVDGRKVRLQAAAAQLREVGVWREPEHTLDERCQNGLSQ